MRKTHLVIHHSGTIDGTHDDWSSIRRYHMSWRYQGRIISEAEGHDLRTHGCTTVEEPWRDIAYHLGVERLGGTLVLRVGRGLDENGAHCFQHGMNKVSLGFCFVGNFDKQMPDLETLEFAAAQLRPILADLEIVPSAETIRMHREFASYKSCPGALFPYDKFLMNLGGASSPAPR